MKTLFTLLALCFTLNFAQAAERNDGHENGNGGDAYAIEFTTLAEKILMHLTGEENTGLDFRRLAKAMDETKVESTDKPLFLDGKPKDALNFPKAKRILFNRARWREISSENRPSLVLHEYLSILRIEDADYSFTRRLLARFRYSDSEIVNVENGRYTCDMNSPTPLEINDKMLSIGDGFLTYKFGDKWFPMENTADGFKGKYKALRSPREILITSRGENAEEIIFGNQALKMRNSALVVTLQVTTVKKSDMSSEALSHEMVCVKE